MEPAVYRREHPGHREPVPGRGRVAMEPAVYRREHRVRHRCLAGHRAVAMEPAVYRREHVQAGPLGTGAEKSQWSPPFIGGSTTRPQATPAYMGGRNGARRL